MARIGITYEQVQAAADALLGQSKVVTINSIREQLGTGSPNTIHAHLVKWRAARPVAQSAAHELPADLVNAFGRELSKAAAAARAEIESVLVQAQQEAAQLSATGETLEQQLSDITEQLNDVAADLAASEKLADERQVEINHLTKEVERERKMTGDAQTEVATLRVTVAEQNKEIETLKQQVTKLTTDLATSTEKTIKAEREKAVAEAQKVAAEEAKQTATDNAAQRYASYEKQLQQAQATEDRINKTVVTIEAKNAELQKRLDDVLIKLATKEAQPTSTPPEVPPVEAPTTAPKAAKKSVKKGE
jgi:chromosome segregation ATPase